jgi:hypothetical protein
MEKIMDANKNQEHFRRLLHEHIDSVPSKRIDEWRETMLILYGEIHNVLELKAREIEAQEKRGK